MAFVAGMEFRFDLDFHELNLNETEDYLKRVVSEYSDLIYGQNTEVRVQLSEGSVRVKLAVIGAIYIGIGQYGSFRSGIDHLIQDAKSLREVVTSQIIKNGLNESDVLENKRTYCDPDRIRRVLLAIERIESNKNISPNDLRKEISKVKASVRNICGSISQEDAGLFASAISGKYWPEDQEIPYFIERYRFVAREEDILHHPLGGLQSKRVNKALQGTSR
ncbi:MAG: hypothetical protein C9356_09390 [Oleiphilus sp.]|nr:MAG: hypothetical protein C9356_09390 [Oleiphilus sp.]